MSEIALWAAALACAVLLVRAESPLSGHTSQWNCSGAFHGWQRVLELHAGHWDVMNVLFFDHVQVDVARRHHALEPVLCAQPPAVNVYGLYSDEESGSASTQASEALLWLRTGQDRTGQERQGRAGQDRAGQSRTEQERNMTGQGTARAGQDRTAEEQERTGQDRTAEEQERRTGQESVDPLVSVVQLGPLPRLSRVFATARGHLAGGGTVGHEPNDWLQPCDVALYVVEPAGMPAFQTHLRAQAEETLHTLLLLGEFCEPDSDTIMEGVLQAISDAPGWEVHTLHCQNPRTPGLLLLSRNNDIEPDGELLVVASLHGSPKHMPTGQLFVLCSNFPNGVFAVPEAFLYRLARSPLQLVFRDANGTVRSRTHERVPPEFEHPWIFRSVKQQTAPSFRNLYLAGHYSGLTVFTTVFAIETKMLFYTIVLPVVESMHEAGSPSFIRYSSGRHHLPVWHVYILPNLPTFDNRVKRYCAYQLEYARHHFTSPMFLEYLQQSAVRWDYSAEHTALWEEAGVANVSHMPLCYHPSIEYNVEAHQPDNGQIFFSGEVALLPRREGLVSRLTGAQLDVRIRPYHQTNAWKTGLYGVEDVVDAALSTVVTNFHAYHGNNGGQLEMPRLIPYLSNGLFVVSERATNAQLEDRLAGMLVFIPSNHSELTADFLLSYLGPNHAAQRALIAAAAREQMQERFACKDDQQFQRSLALLRSRVHPPWVADLYKPPPKY